MSRLSLRWRWCKLTAWTLIPDILQDFQCIFKGDVDTSSDALFGGVVIMEMMSTGSIAEMQTAADMADICVCALLS